MASSKLTDICNIQYGYPFDSSGFSSSPGDGMPLIRIRDVKNGYTDTYYKGNYPSDYIVHKGDYLVGMDGEFNIASWQSEDALLNQRVCKVCSKDSSVLTTYLYRFLSKELKRIEDETPYVTVKHLSAKRLNQVCLEVPSVSEQERIVAELDLLQGIIDKQKTQLKELDTLAQSIFYDMFGTTLEERGWTIKKLGDIGTFQRGGGFLKSDFVDNGFPCIHYGQIHTKLGIATYHHLTGIPENLALTKSKLAETGDVVLAITSEDVEGSCKCTAWMGEYPVAVGGHAAIFKHSLNPIYAAYSFKADYFQNAKEKYAHGFKVVEIKPSDIASISVCVPPRELQNKFANSILTIEQQKANINRSIAETQKLFDYTMDKYFG